MNINELEIEAIQLGDKSYLLTMKDKESIEVHYSSHNVLGLIELLNRRDIHLERA